MSPSAEDRLPSLVERGARRYFGDTRLLFMTLALVVVAGLSSLAILPRMEDPVLTPRAGLVVTRMPGADAERVESLVTEKIEVALRDVDEIKEISSSSRIGISTISIELRDDIYETDAIWAKVRGKLEDAIAVLPPEASRPLFEELETRAYSMILGLTWEGVGETDYRLLRRLAIDLQDRIQNLSGTEVVDRFGDPGEEISVVVDPIRSASLGLSLNHVADQVAAYDAKQTAGQLRAASVSLLIDLQNQLQSVTEIGNIPVASSDGKDIRLSQIAEVKIGTPDPLPRAASLGGRDAVVLGAMVRENMRIDRWTADVEVLLEDYQSRMPVGIGLERLMVQGKYVAKRMDELQTNLLMGAVGVAAVILVMMGWRSALVVTLTLPLASLMVLFGMRLLAIPIHQMSVTGLIIAFGLLIDNGIVVVDEVRGRLTRGESPADAMVGSVKHLSVPLFGSTLTTAFAFAPIALMPGGGGEFVGAIAISVIMAIGSSFILALTVIPTLAARTLGGGRKQDTRSQASWLMRLWQSGISIPAVAKIYRNLLRFCIGHPPLGVACGVLLPLIGFGMATTLREQFFPPTDRNQFYIQVDLPITAAISETRQTASRITPLVESYGAQRVDWFFGESSPEFYYNVIGDRKGQPSFAQAIVTLEEDVNPKPVIRRLQERLDKEFLKPRILVRQLEQGPPFEAPVEVQLFGPNLNELRRLGEEIRQRISNHPDVVAVRSDLSEVLPQLRFQIDESIAGAAGITPEEVSSQLATTLEGRRCGNVMQDSEEVPVVVRVRSTDRGSLQRIQSIDLVLGKNTEAARPRLTPVAAMASVGLEPESAAIPRLDRRRMNEVSVYIRSGVLPSVVQGFLEESLRQRPLNLPSGYDLQFGGEAGERDESVGNLFSTVGLLAVMMVATLVLSFGSFRMASIIGAVGILSVGLAMLSLSVGGYPFGFISIIGTMGLLGVAINDSIVVLAGIRTNPGACRGDVEAAVEEVMHATRHVVATTITTIAGFSPLIIAGGEFWPPLAVAISGGVAGATLLALVLVPSLHQWLIASQAQRAPIGTQLQRRVKAWRWSQSEPSPATH